MKPFALTKHDSERERLRDLTLEEIRAVAGGDTERWNTYSVVGYDTIGNNNFPAPIIELDDLELPGEHGGIGG